MKENDRYTRANKLIWEQKTRVHIKSRFYNVEGFLKGQSSLRPIELSALRNVKGKRLLHLQCHFGMDSLSWAMRGAEVTGVDFSEQAIRNARKLSKASGIPGRFIRSDIYDLKRRLRGKFDIVFASYGCLGWLPDMDRWAEIVAHFLAPRGVLFLVEFHPVYWMLDGKGRIVFPYDSGAKPIVITPQGTYADRKARIKGKEYWWNHGLAKIVNALIQAGLSIEKLQEYPFSAYDGGGMTERKDGTWIKKDWDEKIPLMFSLKARK